MAQASEPRPALPAVRLEVRAGGGRPTVYEVGDGGFLIGGVPGCDLRLPGGNVAPVVCLVSRHARGASLRKLAPVQPIAVNGRNVSSTYLNNGDRITLGTVEVAASFTPGAAPPPDGETRRPSDERLQEIAAREAELQAQAEELEKERILWYRRRDEIEAECRRQTEAPRRRASGLQQQESELAAAAPTWSGANRPGGRRRGTGSPKAGMAAAQSRTRRSSIKEARAIRRQMGQIRETALRALPQPPRPPHEKQKALRRRRQAAAGSQATDSTRRPPRRRRFGKELELGQAENEARAEQLRRERTVLEEQHRSSCARQQELQDQLAARVQECEEREQKVVEDRAALEKGQKQHQADLVRLDRIQAQHEQRKKQLEERRWRWTSATSSCSATCATWKNRPCRWTSGTTGWPARRKSSRKQKQDHETAAAQVEQRAAALEGQQAMLATLRTRVERMREELRRQEQALSDQRVMQEASEADLKDAAGRSPAAARGTRQRPQLAPGRAPAFRGEAGDVDAAVAQLRQAQEALEAAGKGTEPAAGAAGRDGGRAGGTGRPARGPRGPARGVAQPAGGRPADAARPRGRPGQGRTDADLVAGAAAAAFRGVGRAAEGTDRAGAERLRATRPAWRSRPRPPSRTQRKAAELETLRKELADRAAELDALSRDLARSARKRSGREAERLREIGHSLTGQRQALAAERMAFDAERQAASEAAERTRREFETARAEALELIRGLPDLETRAAVGMDRLLRAREQLREHLAEVHGYARQSRDDLEAARQHVQAEAERVRQQELALHVARDEHRLAVAAFRQQLIEWQGRVGEMKQVLLHGETRLERRQAEVQEQAEQVASTSARLAQQAEELAGEGTAGRRAPVGDGPPSERHAGVVSPQTARAVRRRCGRAGGRRGRGGRGVRAAGPAAPTGRRSGGRRNRASCR